MPTASDLPHIAALADREETGPVVLMGLSMGGLTAVAASQLSARVGGVIATTLLDLSDPRIFVRAARWPWLGWLSLATMCAAPWLFDRMRMPLALATPLKAMSSDRRMQRYFQRDRLIGARWVKARFFRTIHAYRLPSYKLRCPLLLLHPGADTWTPTALSLPMYERLEGAKAFIELSNGAHLPAEKPAFDELSRATRQFLADAAQ